MLNTVIMIHTIINSRPSLAGIPLRILKIFITKKIRKLFVRHTISMSVRHMRLKNEMKFALIVDLGQHNVINVTLIE